MMQLVTGGNVCPLLISLVGPVPARDFIDEFKPCLLYMLFVRGRVCICSHDKDIMDIIIGHGLMGQTDIIWWHCIKMPLRCTFKVNQYELKLMHTVT